MTSGRTALAEALTAALPWQIVSDARALDGIPSPGACVLWTATRKRPDLFNLSLVTDEVTLWVVTSADNPRVLEDRLDDLFEQVVEALEPLDAFIWTEATRGVLADKFEGWRLTVTCNIQIETT